MNITEIDRTKRRVEIEGLGEIRIGEYGIIEAEGVDIGKAIWDKLHSEKAAYGTETFMGSISVIVERATVGVEIK